MQYGGRVGFYTPANTPDGSNRLMRLEHIYRQPENDKWQQECIHVPAQQQGQAGFDHQLPKTAFANEYGHTMHGQHYGKEFRSNFVGNFVSIVKDIIR